MSLDLPTLTSQERASEGRGGNYGKPTRPEVAKLRAAARLLSTPLIVESAKAEQVQPSVAEDNESVPLRNDWYEPDHVTGQPRSAVNVEGDVVPIGDPDEFHNAA